MAFIGCPLDIDIFESDATKTPVVGAWAEPSLLPVTVALTAVVTGKTGDYRYPFGTTTVVYSSNVATDHGSPLCQFDIRVRPGFSTTLTTIGTLAQGTGSLHFLIDGHGLTGAQHFMPSFTARPMQPLVASFSTDGGLPLSVDVPNGMQAQLFVSLSW